MEDPIAYLTRTWKFFTKGRRERRLSNFTIYVNKLLFNAYKERLTPIQRFTPYNEGEAMSEPSLMFKACKVKLMPRWHNMWYIACPTRCPKGPKR